MKARRSLSNVNLPDLSDLCQKHHLDLLVLFGSQAAGRTHTRSDFDLAALPARGKKSEILAATMDFCQRLQRGDVELTFISADSSPVLLLEIFSKGVLLFEAEPDLFEHWIVLAHKIYGDTEKFRIAQKLSLEKWLEDKNVP